MALGISALHRALTNPICTGMIRWHGTLYTGSHIPLVSQAIFRQIQERLQGRAYPRADRRFRYRGLLFCGRCGCSITASLAKGRYPYHHCTGAHGGGRPTYVREDRLGQRLASVVRNVELSRRHR